MFQNKYVVPYGSFKLKHISVMLSIYNNPSWASNITDLSEDLCDVKWYSVLTLLFACHVRMMFRFSSATVVVTVCIDEESGKKKWKLVVMTDLDRTLCLSSRAPSTELSALIEKLQKNADKVQKNIYDIEQNLNKVRSHVNTDSLQVHTQFDS